MGGGVDREAIFQDIKQAKFDLSGSGEDGDDDDDDDDGDDDDDDDDDGGGGDDDDERPQDGQLT